MTTPQAGAEMTPCEQVEAVIARREQMGLHGWNDLEKLARSLASELTAARLDIERHVQALGRENDIIIALEDKLEAAEAELAAMGEKIPDALFDGYAVLMELKPEEAGFTNSTHVSAVLDAVVRLIHKQLDAARKP